MTQIFERLIFLDGFPRLLFVNKFLVTVASLGIQSKDKTTPAFLIS